MAWWWCFGCRRRRNGGWKCFLSFSRSGAGWGIAGVFAIGGGAFAAYKNKKAAEEAHKLAIEINKKIVALSPKVRKLEHLIKETEKLKSALNITMMVNTYPKDYLAFSQEQKQNLAALINNV